MKINTQINYVSQIVFPPLYRYLKEEYVDEFFETGKIRLSSYTRYTKMSHRAIGDLNEGFNPNLGRLPDGKIMGTFTRIRENAFMLCTSTINHFEIAESFGANCAIKIDDPYNFSLEIQLSLKNCYDSLFGFVSYQDINEFHLPESAQLANLTIPGTNQISQDRLMEAESLMDGPISFFRKDLCYMNQYEFRFVYLTSDYSTETIDVFCPKARSHCSKVNYPIKSQ